MEQEEYIPIENLNFEEQKTEKSVKSSMNIPDFLKYFFKSIILFFKIIGKILFLFFRGLFNLLSKLSESLEKTRQSEFGKNLMKQYQKQKKIKWNKVQ